MKTLQDLILGRPQRISKGAILVGLSCWHIYPDLNVVGPLTSVQFHDELVKEGGIITLGLQSATPGDIGVRWSLSLSHLRYYGAPVTVSTSSGANASRISMEELQMVALGSLFGAWGQCITDPLVGAKMILVLKSSLCIKTDLELETREPAFHLLCAVSKRLIDDSSDTGRRSNLCLIGHGRRRAQNFLLSQTHILTPAFGLADPDNLWRAFSAGNGIELTTSEEVEKLRSFATLCGFACKHCVIRFRLADSPDNMFAYTTAIPITRHSFKRDPEGKIKTTQGHVCWVTDTSQLIGRSSTTNIAQTHEYVNPADLIPLASKNPMGFSWIRAPESVRAGATQFTTVNGDQPLEFHHLIGNADRSSLFCVTGSSFKKTLCDRDIINVTQTHGCDPWTIQHTILEYIEIPDILLQNMRLWRPDERKDYLEMPNRSSGALKLSLRHLAKAGSMYRQFPGATVSLSVTNLSMYEIPHFLYFETKLSARFACIAMFETGSNMEHSEQLSSVMALSSGNSIYAANALLQDPLNPNLPGVLGITRIVGNIDRPGVVMLAPPQAPLLRPDDPGSWRVINHSNFDDNLKNSFPETSLHLSFTEYKIPLSVPIGAKDAEVSIVETLISTYDRQNWVADLDIIASLRSEDLFKRLSPPRCKHENDRPRPPLEIPVTQIGRISRKQLVSINSWEELLEPPAGLGASSIGVVQAFEDWHARVATMSVSVQKGLRTVVLPTEPLCTVCGSFIFADMEAFAQILIS